MNETIQYILTGIIVAASVFLAIKSTYRAFKNKRSAISSCTNCKLREYCNKPEKNSSKNCNDKVAEYKN